MQPVRVVDLTKRSKPESKDEAPPLQVETPASTPPQSPVRGDEDDAGVDSAPSAPSGAMTGAIMASIADQQRQMQALQEMLAFTAAEQGTRQQQLIEDQLAWYHSQQEMQQGQQQEVANMSRRVLEAEAEQTKTRLEMLAQQQANFAAERQVHHSRALTMTVA